MTNSNRHCEERSDEAVHNRLTHRQHSGLPRTLQALILSLSKEVGEFASWFDKLTMRLQVLAYAVGSWFDRLTMRLQALAHAVGTWFDGLTMRCV